MKKFILRVLARTAIYSLIIIGCIYGQNLFEKRVTTYNLTVNDLVSPNSLIKTFFQGILIHYVVDYNDIVNITIDSNGGYTSIWANLINDIRHSSGKVNMIVEKKAISMGSIIMLTGDTLTVSDNAIILFHRPFVMAAIMKIVVPDDRSSNMHNDLVYNRVIPLLTSKERERYQQGLDVELSGKELNRRMTLLQSVDGYPSYKTPTKLIFMPGLLFNK